MYTTSIVANNASNAPLRELNAHASKAVNLVSEIVYDPQNPFTLHLLMPFLQQLGQQERWQLWLSPERRLNRHWISRLGLSERKSVSLRTASIQESVQTLEKALRSGNFSSVTAWLPALSVEDRQRLDLAAEEGDCYCFILQPMATYRNNISHDIFGNHWH